MTVKEVIKLLDAGYTRDQIAELTEEETVRETEKETDQGEQNPPEKEHAQKAAENPETLKAIENLTKAVEALQKRAAKDAEMEKPPKALTADEIIRDFIMK